MASRYSSRYDGDRRSRSPRDRSPDRYERASQYSDGDRRRSSAEARSNTSAFQNNRDSFRDNLSREPPRGPKALLDPPSGPRGGGYAGEFSRGRGRGRGRGWSRDDSRDRGRDRDIDFRDRRDGPYRDERSRERERDRDWRDREGYRGRPRSPGRGRSPPPRDFRDRDPPLGVDAERSRRGSRDGGPPSAGSSNSDPPYAMSRGGFRGGRDRGRGGWGDRGRGRGGFYDDRDRDRFGPRSRSQEGRWGRDRDERDRGDRWIDTDSRRDPRDDRDARDRELLRPKVDRDRDRGASLQAPSPNTKDISPPPLAPSAPAFGTVPSRNVGAADGSPIIGGTGKLPPTAPRAFNSERPVSAGHAGGSDFPAPPPTGPAKLNLPEGSPPIPSGPRAQQQKQQRPSSKQWINPALAGKKIPESPKIMRSQSFAQQQRPVPFRHDSVPADQGDYERRPRSSDAKADSHASTTEGSVKSLNLPEPGEIIIKSERDSYSARASMDRDVEQPDVSRDTVMTGTDAHGHDDYRPPSRNEEKPSFSDRPAIEDDLVEKDEKSSKPVKESRMSVPKVRFVLPPQEPSAPVSEQTSESDDDEDYGEYFANEIAKEEAELQKLRQAADDAPDRITVRYASVSHEAMASIVMESEGLVDLLGPIPEIVPPPKETSPAKSPVTERREKTPKIPSPVIQTKLSPKDNIADPVPAPIPEPPSEPAPEPKKTPEKAAEKKVETEKYTENAVEQVAEKEIVPEKSVEKPTEVSVEKPVETSAEKPIDAVVENNSEKPLEQLVEKFAENSAEKAADKPVDQPAEVPPAPDAEMNVDPAINLSLPEPQPKTEEMDVDEPAPLHSAPSPPAPEQVKEKDQDAAMEDAGPETASAESAVNRGESKQTTISGQPLILQPPSMPIETIEGDKVPPSTPSQMEDDEDDNSTESEDADVMLIDTIRQYSATPPINSLPDFGCRPWHRDRDFLQSLESDPMIDNFILEQLDKISLEKIAGQEEARKDYADNYVKYLDFTVSNDPIAIKSRETFISCLPMPEKHIPIPPPPELKPEGRGAGRRYASERDLERVLQASMREDEERKEREQRAMQEKYRSEKEAVIPEMYWTQEDRDAEFFKDTTGFTPVEKLVPAWQILPPINNFTPEEAELFEKRYLTNPKQWGVVAENVPKRNFGTCIQYYYLMKKELNLKDKLKKQPKRRKKGRGKTRSSALVSELGNAENEGEENQENGENGERRRPRRAAAPTWGFEQPPTDSENVTPIGTPGRRGAKADPDKPDGRKRGRRAAKDKEPKAAKPQQTLAAAPTPTSGKGRSRSNSRVQNTEAQSSTPAPPENRLPAQFEAPAAGIQPPFAAAQQPPLTVQERPVSVTPSAISEVMAPPSLRPEPPPPPAQPTIATFDIAQPQPERRPPSTASSYWSVSEANDFPGLLKSFGTDWPAIAAHMGSKTAVMVKNYFVRQRDQGKSDWEQFANDADAKRARGEKLPDPPPPTVGGRKKYDATPGGSHRAIASAPAVPVPPVVPVASVTPAASAAPPAAVPADPPSEAVTPKAESAAQSPANPPFGRFPVPVTATPPAQQPQQQQQQQQQHQPSVQAPASTQGTPLAPSQAPQVPVVVQQPHPATQPVVTQSGSPSTRPVRAPQPQGFGFQERERESTQPPQPVRISQKPAATPVTEPVQPRPLAAAQPIQPAQPEAQIDRQQAERQQHLERQAIERQQIERQQMERQRIEQQQHIERQQLERQQIERQQMERQQMERQQLERQALERQQIERQQMERQQIERQQIERQQAERQQMERQQMERQKMEAQQSKEHLRPTERTRMKQEPEMTPPHHHYEPFSFGQQPVRSVPPPRSEPPPVAPRQPAEPPRGAPTPVPQAYGQPMPQPASRGLLGDPQQTVSTPPGQRPIASAQRPMPTHMDSYGTPPQQPQPPAAAAPPPARPAPSERKTSNLMALLNDDPPAAAAAPVSTPQPKRVNDVAQVKPSPTPPPQSMSRGPAPPPAPTPLRPEREPPQGYFGRNAPPSASAMPPLKPTYTASPQAQHMSAPRSAMASPHDAANAVERDYYRHQYQHQPPPATNSPQIAQPYPPQSQPPRDPYQPQTGYPAYGAPAAHAGSPPPQYAVHQSASRREPPPPQGRDNAWPTGPQGHAMGQPQQPQQPQSAWPPSHAPPPKQAQQAPPPQSTWASPRTAAQKIPPAAGMPQQSWASAPPQQQQQQPPPPPPPQHHHMSMRDDRGASMYGQPPPQHQHAMQGRYPPPVSRAPEPMPPQAQQAYPPRYASTPAPRDPRDQMPPRSYTPVGYDARGPPPGPYAPDPREMQMREMGRDPRDPRDPRELQQQAMLQRQLRPHDGYERQPDRYGR